MEPPRVIEVLFGRVPWTSGGLLVGCGLTAHCKRVFDQTILEPPSFLLGLVEQIASELQIESEPDEQVVFRPGFGSGWVVVSDVLDVRNEAEEVVGPGLDAQDEQRCLGIGVEGQVGNVFASDAGLEQAIDSPQEAPVLREIGDTEDRGQLDPWATVPVLMRVLKAKARRLGSVAQRIPGEFCGHRRR